MKIVRSNDAIEDKRHFTGDVVQIRKVNEQRSDGMRVAVVKFQMGGRTFWHHHRGEQVLYVLSGRGWIEAGAGLLEINAGDIVYVSPGERHWHGARAGSELEHLTITVGETDWLEEVPDPD